MQRAAEPISPQRMERQPQARRILVVAPQPFYEDRGTPIAVRQVVEALSELGHEVDVLTFPVGEDVHIRGVRLFRSANPFRVRRVPIGFSARKVVLDGSLVLALRERLGRTRYDCIHAVEEAVFPAVWMAGARGVPVVYDMQSSLPEQLTQHRAFRIPPLPRLLSACEAWVVARSAVIVGSSGLAQRVREIAPLAVVREWEFSAVGSHIPPEAINRLRAELRIPDDCRVVVYTGSFEQYQGLTNLVAAMPAICASMPNTVLVMVGSNNDTRSKLLEQARGLSLNGNLRILPRQPRERMPVFLGMADVLVSPRSHGGNLPLKIFDYLAAGRPIVATDIPTHRTLLNDERAMLVAPTSQAMADGITRVLQDPALAEAMRRAAGTFADEQLGWNRFVRGVEDVYDHAFRAQPQVVM